MFLGLPFLLEQCNLIGLHVGHTAIYLEGLRLDLSQNRIGYDFQLSEAFGLDQPFAELCIVLCFEGYLHLPAIILQKRKHVFVDDIELLPYISDGF